jgi:hypothetical protein
MQYVHCNDALRYVIIYVHYPLSGRQGRRTDLSYHPDAGHSEVLRKSPGRKFACVAIAGCHDN